MTIRELRDKANKLVNNGKGDDPVEAFFNVPIHGNVVYYHAFELNDTGRILLKNPTANLPRGH